MQTHIRKHVIAWNRSRLVRVHEIAHNPRTKPHLKEEAERNLRRYRANLERLNRS